MGWPYDSDKASTSLVGVVSLRGALGAVGDPREGLWAVLQRHTAWNLPCLQALLKLSCVEDKLIPHTIIRSVAR
jgi:hypothetical protein